MPVKLMLSLLVLSLLPAKSACQNSGDHRFHRFHSGGRFNDPPSFLCFLSTETVVDYIIIDPDSLPKLKAKDVAFLIKAVNCRQVIPPVYSEYSTSMWARKHPRSTIGVEAMRWIYAFRKEKKRPWLKYPSAASNYDAVVSRYHNDVNVPKRIRIAEVKIWWFLNRRRLLRH